MRRQRNGGTLPRMSEYITAEQYEQEEEASSTEVREYPDAEGYSAVAEELRAVATSGNGVSRIAVPKELRRQRVVNAFTDAFELIGGVPRLAHWADDHPSDFFKLYARLLPVEASQRVTHDGGVIIRHVLPRRPLDE